MIIDQISDVVSDDVRAFTTHEITQAVLPRLLYMHGRVAVGATVWAPPVSLYGHGLKDPPAHRPVEPGFVEQGEDCLKRES